MTVSADHISYQNIKLIPCRQETLSYTLSESQALFPESQLLISQLLNPGVAGTKIIFNFTFNLSLQTKRFYCDVTQ